MPATDLPDPFALAPLARPDLVARRELPVFGVKAELHCLPGRRHRPGAPLGKRAPFQRCRVDEIIAGEAVWRDGGVVLTGNRFPFAARHVVLWTEERTREAPLALLEAAIAFEDRFAATALVNTTGAAASIARAHVHLVGERLAFLDGFPREPLVAGWLEPRTDVEVVRLSAPYPIVAVGLVGPAGARARAAHRLLQLRNHAAVNVVSSSGVTWVFPHGEHETPEPHFPFALGASELWGRWCYAEREAFERATSEALEQALLRAGVAW